MRNHFQLDAFITRYVTRREIPLTSADMLRYSDELQREIKGKKVLVIGGAGSIGAAFIRSMLDYGPDAIFVVDNNENGLTELVRDLRSQAGVKMPGEFRTYPMGFGDSIFEKMLRQEGPFDIVANFAAHKHVRSEKDVYAIEAMLENNVLRTRKLMEQLREYGPPAHFFCVSTDKASNPANIMGASKQLMEQVIMAYSSYFPVTTARFANVAFSQGSLPDGFLKRLGKQQPLSAPSDIRRYFIAPKEAGEICLLTCLVAGSGQIVFPKLLPEQQCTFTSIAEHLLQEFGYQPYICQTEEEARAKATSRLPEDKHYPVYFFRSHTSGEKTEEEFYAPSDCPDWAKFENLGVVEKHKSLKNNDFMQKIDQLEQLLSSPATQKEHIVQYLEQLVEGFSHVEKGRHLDQVM